MGGGGRRGGQGNVKKKTKSVLHNLKVTLEDVYTGKTKYLEISRYRTCQTCKGSGSKDPNANTKCTGCNGKGMKTIVRQISMGMIQQTVQCNDCKGEGYVIKEKDKCKACKGQKSTQEKKTLEVHVDKGAPDGKRYSFVGESDEFPDYEPGDIIVEIQIEKHKKFHRKGADLVYTADITLIEALTGCELAIEHLDKRKILIKSKPMEVIKPGVLKTVKELGMPFFEQPYRFGNLYISFNLIFPDKVDNAQTKALSEVNFIF
jgi:DnaJ family protein A protein 2